MCTQSIDYGDVMVPLLTVAVGLGVAGALFAVPSIATPAAIAAGLFASTLAILVALAGTIGWAMYAAVFADGKSREQHLRRSGAA